MDKKILSGNEAFARGAFEAGINLAAGYPGTPSTEILEAVVQYKNDIYCEWSPNEKVAFEVAAGASLTGARSLVTMKHVGLNVAADPLMTLAYTGVVGGFVAIVADDPGMHSSQNEQDTRHFARFAKIPLLEPADSQEALDFMKLGIEISEKYNTPVILRSTTRISHSRSPVSLSERFPSSRAIGFEKDPPRFVPVPVWGRKMRLRLEEKLLEMSGEVNHSFANRIEWRDRKLGIIAEGIAYQYVREVFPEASVLKIGWFYPFPDQLIREFAAGVDRLLVVEELEEILEEHIRSLGIDCIGKEVVPSIGELSTDVLTLSRARLEGLPAPQKEEAPPEVDDLPARPPVLCAGCPHRAIFYALGRFDVVVTGDIGCYSLGTFAPLNRIDTILCMGGGVSMAHGMDRAGEPRKVVGMVGDSTFFHSGITGLLDIAYNRGSSTTIVLDNRTTAMTGHQCHPGTGETLMGEKAVSVSIEEIGKACGISNVATLDPYQIEKCIETLKKAIDSPEPWLLVSRAVCPLHARKKLGPTLSVDEERCVNCGKCLNLGCPAIEGGSGKPRVNPLLCSGCGMCLQVCPVGAFKSEEEACDD
jgi:indolepyruvate ferredoxin oxidoreductase, alpha subunit